MNIDVRMYNVGFGDCFLVTIPRPKPPEAERTPSPFRMLIDCGRHAGSRPPDPTVGEVPFEEVVRQLIVDLGAEDGEQPKIDVIVVSHRHRDHVHGFSYKDLWKQVQVDEVWLPWVEDPENPFAVRVKRRQETLARRSFHALRALAFGAGEMSAEHREAVEIAYNATTNEQAMSTLMDGGFADQKTRLRFLPRLGQEPDVLDRDNATVLPDGVTVHVLGPSRDPKVITKLEPPSGKTYEPLMPFDGPLPASDHIPDDEPGRVPAPFPPSWVTTASAYKFGRGGARNVRAIMNAAMLEPLELVYRLDNAINGTSLVLLLEVGDTKLLFPGDAQWGTWDVMLRDPRVKELLQGTTLYKVGHHGSHNATPIEFVTDCLSKDATQVAMISVGPTSYGGGWQHIPLQKLVKELVGHTKEVVRSDGVPTKRRRGSRPAGTDGRPMEPVQRTIKVRVDRGST